MRFCRVRGWDYSISVTNDGYRRPILESLKGLPESAWTDIGGGETATITKLSRKLMLLVIISSVETLLPPHDIDQDIT